MSQLVFVGLFALLVFLPCLAAITSMRPHTVGFPELEGFSFAPPRALGRVPDPVCALGLERPVTEQFQIRSFEKGLRAKRRMLIRDGAAVMIELAAELADAVADVPAAAQLYPRTRRRGLVMAMVEAQGEVEASLTRALDAQAALTRLLATSRRGPQANAREQQLAYELQEAESAAREASRRVSRLEALLQGRPDAELQLPIDAQDSGRRTLAA